MRLIVLSGHERKMTKVMFNRGDDLIFTAAADNCLMVWDAETGERLGTYDGPNGHTGAVFDFDVDYQTKFLLSGSGDSTVKIWKVMTGEPLTIKTPVRVSSVQWACGDKLFLAASPQFLKTKACVRIYQNPMSREATVDADSEPLSAVDLVNDSNENNFVVAKAVWSPQNEHIYALCTDNSIRIIDVEKQKQMKKIIFVDKLADKMKLDNEVGKELTDFRYNKDYCTAILSSRAKFAKMYDINRWHKQKNPQPLATYECDRALNTVAIHPTLDMVALGGGKTAQQAALDKRNGKYEACFYHKIFEEKIGTIESDCFSPLNSMDWNSDGSSLVLGYEEGQARVFMMDADFERQFAKRSKQFTTITKDDSDSDNDDDLY